MENKTQSTLLCIVKSWDIQSQPEYRGFRCGGCQKFLEKEAWHYLLHSGGYIFPLHFCDQCHEKIENNKFETPSAVSHANINSHYSSPAIAAFENIVHSWDFNQKSVKKEFQCDNCGMSLVDHNKAQGYHVWWRREDKTLVELHFDKDCGEKLLK